jgi:hypothetical protein
VKPKQKSLGVVVVFLCNQELLGNPLGASETSSRGEDRVENPFYFVFEDGITIVTKDKAQIHEPKWMAFDGRSYWEEISVVCQQVWDLDENSLSQLETRYLDGVERKVEELLKA